MLPDIWKKYFSDERINRDQLKLTRKLRSLRHLGSTKVQIGSHEFLNFSSNDYLGLTGDLRIAEAAASAAGRFGWGTAASRLVTGSSTLHTKLEGEVAAFRGTENALVYGSGYQANLGVISALVGAGDTILSDELNHASIVAGSRLSGASVRVFGHLDYDDLERQLNSIKKGRVLVVTDSLFSIEGDLADVPRVVKLCERHNALLVVDDAHGNACLGKRGRGVPEMQGVGSQVPIVVGNFSKALGSYGGFVACTEEVRDFLVNNSRPFIYTTAIPVALAAANLEALKIVRKEGDALRQRLSNNAAQARSKLESAGFELTGKHHIIGIRIGSPEEAVFLGNEVEFHGILVHPMRYPTVAEGKDCLRISITAGHTEEDIARLIDALKKSRGAVSKKKTDGLTRRQNKRPTHQQLEMAAAPMEDNFGDFDDHPSSQMMSAQDSNRLPPPSEVADFRPEDEPATAGDTLMVNPKEFAGNDNPTRPVVKEQPEPEDAAEEESDKDTDPVAAEAQNEETNEEPNEKPNEEPNEEPNEKPKDESGDPPAEDSASGSEDSADLKEPDDASGDASGDEEIDEELPTDDDPPESGSTLAPEQMELADPVIAEIEGGTKKRKRKTKMHKKHGK